MILVVGVLSLGICHVRAEGVPVTLTPSVATQYMFRGVRMSGPSFQPTVEVGLGNGALGVWSNFPLKDKVLGVSDPEIDPYGYYTVTVNESLSVVPGFTVYMFPRGNTGNGFYRSTFEPNLALNCTVGGVRFTPKVYYDLVLSGPTGEFAVACSIPLKDLGTSLDFLGVAGTFIWRDAAKGANPRVKNWGDYYQVGVSSTFEIDQASKVSVGFALTKGTDNFYKQGSAPRVKNTAAVSRGVFTLSYIYSF
jgi:hypothetical protein